MLRYLLSFDTTHPKLSAENLSEGLKSYFFPVSYQTYILRLVWKNSAITIPGIEIDDPMVARVKEIGF